MARRHRDACGRLQHGAFRKMDKRGVVRGFAAASAAFAALLGALAASLVAALAATAATHRAPERHRVAWKWRSPCRCSQHRAATARDWPGCQHTRHGGSTGDEGHGCGQCGCGQTKCISHSVGLMSWSSRSSSFLWVFRDLHIRVNDSGVGGGSGQVQSNFDTFRGYFGHIKRWAG